LIDPDACRESSLPADPFEHVYNINAAEGEPRLQRRREAGERIDNRQHTQLDTSGNWRDATVRDSLFADYGTGSGMQGRRGFWDVEDRLKELSAEGDPLERQGGTVDFELFRPVLVEALGCSDPSKGGRPGFDPVLM
jgi:hypothetical protein